MPYLYLFEKQALLILFLLRVHQVWKFNQYIIRLVKRNLSH